MIRTALLASTALIMPTLAFADPAVNVVATSPAQDINAIVLSVAGSVLTVVGGVALQIINKFVKDKAAQDIARNGIDHAAAWAINKGNGLLIDHPVPIDRVPAVVLDMLHYSRLMFPDARKRLGLDDVKMVRRAVAALPGVSGGDITDADINSIAAAASGTAPPVTAGALVNDAESLAAALAPQLLPVMERAMEAMIAAKLKEVTAPVAPPLQGSGA